MKVPIPRKQEYRTHKTRERTKTEKVRVNSHMKVLTPEEKAVVAEYLKDFSARQASIRLSLPQDRVKKILKRPHVRINVSNFSNNRIKKTELTAEAMLKELYYMATRDVIDLTDPNGQIIIDDLRRLPKRIRKCIDGITVREVSRTDQNGNEIVTKEYKLKLTPKLDAVNLAMKYLKMLVDQVETTNKHTLDWDSMVKPPAITPTRLLEERLNDPTKTDEQIFQTIFPDYKPTTP